MNRLVQTLCLVRASSIGLATIAVLLVLTPLSEVAVNRLQSCADSVNRCYAAQGTLTDVETGIDILVSSKQSYDSSKYRQYSAMQDAGQKSMVNLLASLQSTSESDSGLRSLLSGIAQTVAADNAGVDKYAPSTAAISNAKAEVAVLLARRTAELTCRFLEAQIISAANIGLAILTLALEVITLRGSQSTYVTKYVRFVEGQRRNLEIANLKLADLASCDGLTGVMNHATFRERLSMELSMPAQNGGLVSLLMIDVDRFKDYNDTYGHQAGDSLLVRLARLLSDAGRSTDVVARYGGEEFAMLLPETGQSGAHDFAERLRRRIEMELSGAGNVTVSIGVATAVRSATNSVELVEAADKALYRSKSTGRNRVTLHDGELFERRQRGRSAAIESMIARKVERFGA